MLGNFTKWKLSHWSYLHENFCTFLSLYLSICLPVSRSLARCLSLAKPGQSFLTLRARFIDVHPPYNSIHVDTQVFWFWILWRDKYGHFVYRTQVFTHLHQHIYVDIRMHDVHLSEQSKDSSALLLSIFSVCVRSMGKLSRIHATSYVCATSLIKSFKKRKTKNCAAYERDTQSWSG